MQPRILYRVQNPNPHSSRHRPSPSMTTAHTEPTETNYTKPQQYIPRPITPLLLPPPLLPLRRMQLRQIKSHPPRRQPNPLLLIQIHAGVIPLQQCRIRPLRTGILCQLLRFLDAEGAFFFCFWMREGERCCGCAECCGCRWWC